MRRIEIAVMGAAAVAASVYLSFWPNDVQDYARDAAPALHPFINGHLHAALGHQPAMGWFAILWRAPFAFFARHGSALVEYRVGALACVLALAAVAVWLCARMRRAGRPLAACALILALALIGPMNWHALMDGHPEELLGAALCVAAVLLAADGHSPLVAGIALGLALVTKQWAVLALGPVLIAAPHGRVRIAATAIAIGAALTVIPAVAGPGLLAPANAVAPAVARAQPASIWWPLGHAHQIHAAGLTIESRSIPAWLASLTHPGIVLLGLVLALPLLSGRRRPASSETALTLLALLFLLRCVLDPMTVGYYHVPLLVSLVTLEALHRRGLPLLSLLSTGVLWLLVARVPWGSEPAKVAAIYLAWSLPFVAYLAGRLYAPTVTSDLGKWLRISLPSSVTTTRSSIRTPNAPGM